MDVRAIAFDVNGTLIDILTEDDRADIFRAAGHFLTYQGIDLRRHDVRDLYFETLKRQQKASPEQHPEYSAPEIWRTIIDEHMTDFSRGLPAEKLAQMPLMMAEFYRGMTRRRLKLYPHVRQVLEALRTRYALAIVTDGQSSWARGELHKVGLTDYFGSIVISGDHGFRKPDRRLFQFALDEIGVPPERTIYVGNDMHRDIFGAREAGMMTVMFDSEHGTKEFHGCTPDYKINDHRQLLGIVGL